MLWNEHTVTVNGVALHVYRTPGPGANRPTLVLAHGAADSALCWGPVAEALGPEYDIVLYDARGHGRSESPAAGYGWEAHTADLAGLIEALALARPILIGHSMGAFSAALVAARHPERVRALVLEDPPWMAQRPAGDPAGNAARWRGEIEESNRLDRETLMSWARTHHPTWSLAEIDVWATAKQQANPRIADLSLEPPPAWRALLPSVSPPTLLITGDPGQGAIVTPEVAAAALALAPNLQVAHLPGAGHSVRRDQFGPFLTALRAFLEEQRTGAS